MPQARWQCLNFSGTGHVRLIRFPFLILIGCFATLEE
jgi:hypothetical protein